MLITHPLSPSSSHMCIRETDETMKKLMSTVYSQLQSKLSQMGIVTRADPFNVLMVHVIRPGQLTPCHADTNHTIDGHFDVGSNSQQKDSIVAIFAFGDSRTLKFRLVYKKEERQKVNGKMTTKTVAVPLGHEFHFTLAHGTLFVLSPHDEKPMHRTGFGTEVEKHLSYWTHESNGISKMLTSHSASHYARASILWRCTSSLASCNCPGRRSLRGRPPQRKSIDNSSTFLTNGVMVMFLIVRI